MHHAFLSRLVEERSHSKQIDIPGCGHGSLLRHGAGNIGLTIPSLCDTNLPMPGRCTWIEGAARGTASRPKHGQQKLVSQKAEQHEKCCAGLLALGSVQLYKGQKKLQEAAGEGPDSIRAALPGTMEHCDKMEHWYNEALRLKPDSYDACIYMAQLYYERCKATALFAVPVIE